MFAQFFEFELGGGVRRQLTLQHILHLYVRSLVNLTEEASNYTYRLLARIRLELDIVRPQFLDVCKRYLDSPSKQLPQIIDPRRSLSSGLRSTVRIIRRSRLNKLNVFGPYLSCIFIVSNGVDCKIKTLAHCLRIGTNDISVIAKRETKRV